MPYDNTQIPVEQYLEDFHSLALAQEAFWSDVRRKLSDDEIEASVHWTKENKRHRKLFGAFDYPPQSA